MTKILTVEGMMCPHCKASVEKALMAVAGVTSAAADLEAKTATVLCDDQVAEDALQAAVIRAGFQVTSIS